MSVVIAIDGTDGCGKGTLARRLARHYGFAHLDSGALYRLVALGVLDAGGDPSKAEDAAHSARNIDTAAISDPRLRSVDVGEAASIVAAIPDVRSAILQFQQDFAAHRSLSLLGKNGVRTAPRRESRRRRRTKSLVSALGRGGCGRLLR